jgi:hypothetical protein
MTSFSLRNSAEIDEPFYAWVDFKNGSSRIDFYGGKKIAIKNMTTLLILCFLHKKRYDENLPTSQ